MKTKTSLIRLLAAAALLAAALPCAAQQYPAKPILAVMPLQAGSAVDVLSTGPHSPPRSPGSPNS